MPPVEAALREAGGLTAESLFKASGASARACAVDSCNASIALTGDTVFVPFALDARDDSSLSA